MANPVQIAELIRVGTTRQLTPDEIGPALNWLREAEREEVAGALLKLAEIESAKMELESRTVAMRERQLDMVSKHVMPKLAWGLITLAGLLLAGLASKLGLPIALVLEEMQH
mgnify:CR=1 FL=1|tara:strand:+ start:2320 stop:2655 length:336 start_codon:yes stop_codon:yes gene_type:complete